MGMAKDFGKGMAVTLKTMLQKSETVQYPHEVEERAPRTRGVIALKEENCTVCMLCARECPVWCIFIEGYKDQGPPRRAGGKPRLAQKLDRFDIDYSLCMYCGICVDVCPFDALFWAPDFEYSEPHIADLLHDKNKLGEWMDGVPAKPALDEGAEVKAPKGAARAAAPERPKRTPRTAPEGGGGAAASTADEATKPSPPADPAKDEGPQSFS